MEKEITHFITLSNGARLAFTESERAGLDTLEVQEVEEYTSDDNWIPGSWLGYFYNDGYCTSASGAGGYMDAIGPWKISKRG